MKTFNVFTVEKEVNMQELYNGFFYLQNALF